MQAAADPAPSSSDAARVVVQDRQTDVLLVTERWANLLRCVLREEGVAPPYEAGLTFVDATEMAEINRSHRGVERPTDVLAFGTDDGSALRAAGEPRLVGDVVICPAVAAAGERGHDLHAELALLVVHGALHLLGYDHEVDADAEVMQRREAALLAATQT